MTEERIDGEETTGKKKPKKSLKRELMEDIIMIVFVLITVWVMKNYVLINAVIPSASMEDTIMTGDRIFGSRLSYEFGEPQRGSADPRESLRKRRISKLALTAHKVLPLHTHREPDADFGG